MSEGMPDWLDEIAPGEDEEMPSVAGEPDGLMDDLRMGLDSAAEAASEEEARESGGAWWDILLPWQRFILSILLFLDVLIIGMLFLTMLGRISI